MISAWPGVYLWITMSEMRKINIQSEDLMKKAAEELQKKNLEPLLTLLQQNILKTSKMEEEAFKALNDIF